MSEEKTIFRGSPSFVSDFFPFLLGALLVGGGVAAGLLVNPLLLIVAGAAALCMLVRWVVLRFTTYEITSERLFLRRGILTRRTDELELYRVRDVALVEPFLLRLFGKGNLVLTSNDETTPTLTLEAIPTARELREQLRAAIETCRDRKRVRLTEWESPDPET